MKKQTFSPILNSEIAPYVCLLRIKNRGLIKRSDLCYLCVCRFCRFRNLRFCFFDPLGEFAFVLLAGFGVDIAFFAFAAGQSRTDASFPQVDAYLIQASGVGFAYLSLDLARDAALRAHTERLRAVSLYSRRLLCLGQPRVCLAGFAVDAHRRLLARPNAILPSRRTRLTPRTAFDGE